jgi:hypothetical protein
MTDDAADNKLAEECAIVLMGRRECERCEGFGKYYQPMYGHEDCGCTELVECGTCEGRGWIKA